MNVNPKVTAVKRLSRVAAIIIGSREYEETLKSQFSVTRLRQFVLYCTIITIYAGIDDIL